MNFTRAMADQLRASLPVMDFNAARPDSELMQAYCDYYGLNFSSRELPVRHSAGLLRSGEFDLVCHHFSVPLASQRGTAFLVHGYFDHTGIYGHLIRHCLQTGYAVVIFDLPGHGVSSGPPASIDSFKQYGAALGCCLDAGAALHQPWLCIGQSTGAGVIMDSLLHQDLAGRHDIAHYLLLGPLLRPARWLTSSLLFNLSRWLLSSSPRSFANNSHDPQFLEFIRRSDDLQSRRLPRDWVLAMIDYQKRFAAAPPLALGLKIIQGSDDGTVDWRYNLPRIEAKFPGTVSYMVSAARHQLVNEAPEYRERVFSLIQEIVSA